MILLTQNRGGLWRIVRSDTLRIAKATNKKALDQGGYRTQLEALRKIKELAREEEEKDEEKGL